MELLDHAQIRPELSRIATAMRGGFDLARPPVALEQILDKAQTDPKKAGQVSLGAFSSLVGLRHLQSKVSRIRSHPSVLLLPMLTASLYRTQAESAMSLHNLARWET